MTNTIARRVKLVAASLYGAGVLSTCGGGAALVWNNAGVCGGLRQLLWPRRVQYGDGHFATYVPWCPTEDHLHTLWVGLALLLVGVLLVFVAQRVMAAASGLSLRRPLIVLMWAIGLALFGTAIMPVGNFAVDSFDVPRPNGRVSEMMVSRVTRVPGAMVAVGGLAVAILAFRRIRTAK